MNEQLDLFTGSEHEPLVNDFDIVGAVKFMKHYWNTYDQQWSYQSYMLETFLEDALYSSGVAISDDYRFADGLDRFKQFLQRRWFKRNLKGRAL